jgi:hypothetical protein
VSLNNRISIRDAYGAHGGLVGPQNVADPGDSNTNSPCSESTTETMIAETEKPKEDLMRQLEPILEEVEEEWVISESCGRLVMVPISLLPRAAPGSADIA